jgi:IS1 family transposase
LLGRGNFQKKDLNNEEIIHDNPVIELDEMWTFVGSRENDVWIWLALEVNSRKVIGYAIGDRSINTFKRLWDGICDKIKRNAIFYTDRWDAYNLIPYKQRIVKRGGTNHIERLFLTLRNDNPRFTRKTLRFSKSLDMLEISLKLWIHYYNSYTLR